MHESFMNLGKGGKAKAVWPVGDLQLFTIRPHSLSPTPLTSSKMWVTVYTAAPPLRGQMCPNESHGENTAA